MKVAENARAQSNVKWFRVDLKTINKNFFKRVKKDSQQEMARRIIREAFDEVRNNPEKYPEKFRTMTPEKTWKKKPAREFKVIASEAGDHAADWVEQALVWAQRISNGESWKKVCNDPDTEDWYRAIAWKEGTWKLVGGSKKLKDENSSTSVYHYNYPSTMHLKNAVPLIVSYE